MPCLSSRANVNASLRTGLIDQKPTGRSRLGTIFSSSVACVLERNPGGARWVGVATASAPPGQQPSTQTCFVLLGSDGVLLEQRAAHGRRGMGGVSSRERKQDKRYLRPFVPFFPSQPTSHTPP